MSSGVMPECECLHAASDHPDVGAVIFPCLQCGCVDYEVAEFLSGVVSEVGSTVNDKEVA